MKINRFIENIAIVGSGIMGSRIACHFANIGVQVLLLDIIPSNLKEDERENKKLKNAIVNNALEKTIKSKPSPLYLPDYQNNITTGNLEDDLDKISDVDWIIEVVIEKLSIKQEVFKKIEIFRSPGTLISSNTSGIPIEKLIEDRSEDFKEFFCGTHFFNPPRYLKLLEIIPSSKTKQKVIDFHIYYGNRFLGKDVVVCKDTPAFIANRIGVANIMHVFHTAHELELTIDEIDLLTGPIIGRPKSATFRTCDLVGLDTLIHVANGVRENCSNDEMSDKLVTPIFINEMLKKNWLGDKTGQGFYKKNKDINGVTIIECLDIKNLKYTTKSKRKFLSIADAKKENSLKDKIKLLINAKDIAGDFYRKTFYNLFSYISNRIPEISEEIYKIDRALKAGFGWELGPFEIWDIIGVENSIKKIEEDNFNIAPWVKIMIKKNKKTFYSIENESLHYYNINNQEYNIIDDIKDFIILDNIRKNNIIWKNNDCNLIDIGDGIVNLEWNTKMNSISEDVLNGINHSINIVEKNHKGLVIANQGNNFSVGANIAMIFMMAIEQEYDEIDYAIRLFQQTTARIRYSSIPVVVATHGLTLAGGCEISLHADQVQASAETYMGLVEMGIGLIPAGGGTKAMAERASEKYLEGDIKLPTLKERYLNIGMAKVSTSANNAQELDLLLKDRDKITIGNNNLISDAKIAALNLSNNGYKKPINKKIKILGKQALGMFIAGANSMYAANYISKHDMLISEKLAYVICGGDLSSSAEVSEKYLLDLEREAFLSLTGERKTLERIEHMLKKGKPLRN
jgi:3-hydroxyacyl-CoA dehydrogenase